MDLAIEILSGFFLISGTIMMMISGIGLIRLPDMYTRIHAGGINDTLGSGLVFIGLMLLGDWGTPTLKLGLIIAFLFFTSPVTTHALARAALTDKFEPKVNHTLSNQEEVSSKAS
ncbi:MAG: monovalent cation/H(+) antiporter subunit G [Magnetococcales bacterium]|nr:monovalent cation/H(+) antiporter subunit G [Magnetococcales bacterium]